MALSEPREDARQDRPRRPDREVVAGPYLLYAAEVARNLGATFDVIAEIGRPSPADDLLLSGYAVPYDAVIDGVRVPVSAESAWWAELREAGRAGVRFALTAATDWARRPSDEAMGERARSAHDPEGPHMGRHLREWGAEG